MSLPLAVPLARLAPSSYEIVRMCPLRMAFRQASAGSAAQGAAARVGEACHEVLEKLVAEGELLTDVWRDTLDARFGVAITKQEMEFGGSLRGARLARARLQKVAARMSTLLQGLPRDAVLPEQELETAEGRLVGTIDLIVRSESAHFIADYKTGSAVEAETGEIKERYRRQLMLYACLEESAHTWPRSATIIPFASAPLSIDVDPEQCLLVLRDVLSALEVWRGWGRAGPSCQCRTGCVCVVSLCCAVPSLLGGL